MSEGSRKAMNKRKIIGLLVLVSSLILTPVISAAEMYFGLYGGINLVPDTDVDVRFSGAKTVYTYKGVGVDPAIIGGLKFGYWFSREGTLAFNYPDWMKYFGIEMDLSIHELNWPRQSVLEARVPYMRRTISENYGYGITFAVMVMGRYGFLPDSDVPFGRLQPYLGIGPGAFLSVIDIFPNVAGRSDSQALCLNVETGIRYLIVRSLSVNLSLKYRYIVPPYFLDENYWENGQQVSNEFLTVKPNYHMFTIILGVAYHF
jgi:hypothetical protein